MSAIRNDGFCTEPCKGVGVLHPYHGVGKEPTGKEPMARYEVGTVAVATVRGVPNVRVMRYANRTANAWASDAPVGGGFFNHPVGEVTDVRPLIVLDLREIAHWNGGRGVPGTLRDCATLVGAMESKVLRWLADQIEEQTRPPKPPEPTNWLSAVEDASGRRWVRMREDKPGYLGRVWVNDGGAFYEYAEIDAVRVLSEGVK